MSVKLSYIHTLIHTYIHTYGKNGLAISYTYTYSYIHTYRSSYLTYIHQYLRTCIHTYIHCPQVASGAGGDHLQLVARALPAEQEIRVPYLLR